MQNQTKGIIFYTDNQAPTKLAHEVQNRLRSVGLPIASSSLKPMPHFGKNIYLKLKRGWITMNIQILEALKNLDTKYVYFCEHDVLYNPSHFEFTPTRDDVYYYNLNVWKLRYSDGLAVKVDFCQQLSGMVCNRELAINHYQKRLEMLRMGIPIRKIGFEPGTHTRKERVDEFKTESYFSEIPLIDVRTGENATSSRWNPKDFRNEKFTKGWVESYKIPLWGKTSDILKSIK